MELNRPVIAVPTLEALQGYVHQTLCQHDRLDLEQSPLKRGLIRRSGRPCGMLFQVEGPRALKTHAVWSGEENRILFYDSAGMRFGETRLSESPDPGSVAA